MNDEYVKKDEVINHLRDVYEREHPTGSGEFDEYACHEVPQAILNMKPANVKPIIYGKWIPVSDDDQDAGCFICSHCNTNIFIDEFEPLPNFCSNCGADMKNH